MECTADSIFQTASKNRNCDNAAFLAHFISLTINEPETVVALCIGELNNPLTILDFPTCVLPAEIRFQSRLEHLCSQCSSIYGSSLHSGHVGSTVGSS